MNATLLAFQIVIGFRYLEVLLNVNDMWLSHEKLVLPSTIYVLPNANVCTS